MIKTLSWIGTCTHDIGQNRYLKHYKTINLDISRPFWSKATQNFYSNLTVAEFNQSPSNSWKLTWWHGQPHCDNEQGTFRKHDVLNSFGANLIMLQIALHSPHILVWDCQHFAMPSGQLVHSSFHLYVIKKPKRLAAKLVMPTKWPMRSEGDEREHVHAGWLEPRESAARYRLVNAIEPSVDGAINSKMFFWRQRWWCCLH